MPTFATGRSRSAAVIVYANVGVAANSLIDGSLGFNTLTSSAFGVGVGCEAVVFDRGFETDPTYGLPDPGVRIRYYITMRWAITIGGIAGQDYETFTTGYSDWIILDTPPQQAEVESSPAEYQSPGVMSVTVNAGWTLSERLDEDLIAGSYTEARGDPSGSVSAFGFFTFLFRDELITVNFNTAYAFSSPTWANLNAGHPDQGISATLLSGDGVSVALTATLDGISWGQSTASLAASNATLDANGLSVTLPRTGPGPYTEYATGTWSCSPDWAHDYTVENWDYETGDPVAVTTRHETGGDLVSLSTAGAHRFPASGLTSSYAASLSCNSVVDSESRDETLGTCAPGGGANYIRVDEEWGDATGRFLNSFHHTGSFPGTNPGIRSQYGLLQSQAFDAGTFQVDAEHEFQLFEDTAHLELPSGSHPSSSLGMVGGLLRVVAGGLLPQQFTGYSASFPSGYVFKPFGYRYYRFEIKGTAGNQFRFELGRKLNGSGDYAVYSWDVTITRDDTWQRVELDLCHPDNYFDDTTFPLSPSTRRRIEPALFQLFPDATTFTGILQDPGTYWFRGLTGFYVQGGNRTPALLLGPCSCGETCMDTLAQAPAIHDSCIGTTENSGKVSGGILFGRLIANGACAFNFETGVGRLDDVFDAWIATYGDAANDTGLHFAKEPSTANYQAATIGENGWEVERPLWRELTLGAPVTLRGRKRGFGYGYYGQGSIHTGAYGAVLSFRADQVWNGELIAALHDGSGAVPGLTLDLLDDDLGLIVTSATADDDGLCRLFAKYGAQETFSNYPRADACAARQQYSGLVPDNSVIYTTLGGRLNGYWVRGRNLRERDDLDRATYWWPIDRFAILDRYPAWREFNCYPGAGLDSTSTLFHWYLESWVERGDIYVGTAYHTLPPFAHTAQVTSQGLDSYPALCRVSRERTGVWWQRGNGSGAGVWRVWSDDEGRTWGEPEEVFVSGRFPRAAFEPYTGALLEMAYQSGQLVAQITEPSSQLPGAVFYPSGVTNLAGEPFSLVWHRDRLSTLVLSTGNSGTITRYYSYDRGRSFEQVL